MRDDAPDLSMRRSLSGRVLARLYGSLPASVRGALLGLVVRGEGGQMRSLTLRSVLRRHHGVDVGPHSYGSLLDVGMADRLTTIGPYVSVGPGVRRFGAAHPQGNLSMHPYWYNPSLGLVPPEHDVDRTPCEIGADAWIGAHVVILPGCRRIGVGAVIGAGSVVTHDVPDFAVAHGNPARVVRLRLDARAREWLLEQRPWDLPPARAQEAMASYRAALDDPGPDAAPR